jgi:formylglycine-generating enzyme required for sulfatase activity/serine/threonine protein kinase
MDRVDGKPITDESVLADLVSLWQQRRSQGEPISCTELCRDHPELVPELERRVAILERMGKLAAGHETKSFSPADSLESSPQPNQAGRTDWPVIPGYEILKELGRGGMGVVYQARDTYLNRLVALKMVLFGAHSSKDSLERFRAEAEAVARLQHPHVVQVFSWGEHGEQPFLVMEFVAGGSLYHCIAGRKQPPADAARLVMLLARAVHAAHKVGILHRDLKPANVLLAPPADEPALNSAYGCPKVSDFGLARLSGSPAGLTASFALMGTPSYMSPEQALGKTREIGPSTDIYALGAILYELLAGQPPFKGENLLETLEQVRKLPPLPLQMYCPDVPPKLEAICLGCLAKSPADRPPTAADLAQDLRCFLDEHPSTVSTAPLAASVPLQTTSFSLETLATTPARLRRLMTYWGWLVAAALLVVLGIAGVAWNLLQHPERAPLVPNDPERAQTGKEPPSVPGDTNSLGMRLAQIPAGRFLMGSPDTDTGGEENERPRHEVAITRPFDLGVHEVTVEQFRAFVRATDYQTDAERRGRAVGLDSKGEGNYLPNLNWRNPGFRQSDAHPVACVSWNDALAFCEWLGREEGRKYRLPTEAEWEYACRAGTTTRFFSGDGLSSLREVANIADRALFRCCAKLTYTADWDDGYPFTAPVGQFRPNAFGLHDMHGNVSEWCADWYDKDYYKNSPPQDPKGPDHGRRRIARGGSWHQSHSFCSAAYRYTFYEPPEGDSRLGFRVVRER